MPTQKNITSPRRRRRRRTQIQRSIARHRLRNTNRQREQRKEDTQTTKDDDTPESVIIERIPFVSPQLAYPLRLLCIHVEDQLPDAGLEDIELGVSLQDLRL